MKNISQPYLSVIIPVYNAEKSLLRCVDSVLNQSFKDFEVLLIDDGSTDNSAVLCDELATRDCRIRVFHQPNGGVSSARNRGLKNAVGKWGTFIDSDDWIETDYLTAIMEHCKEFPLVVSGFKRYGDIEDKAGATYSYTVNIKDELHLIWGKSLEKFLFWYVWGKMYLMDIIRDNNILFNENMKYNEDNCFVLEYMSYVKSFLYVPNFGYIHFYEKGRSRKYSMDFEIFHKHIEQQEQSFLQLENNTGHRYSLVRQNIHRRFWECFLYNLAQQKSYFSYKKEIYQFKRHDRYHTLYNELRYSFKIKLLWLILFEIPSFCGFIIRHFFEKKLI